MVVLFYVSAGSFRAFRSKAVGVGAELSNSGAITTRAATKNIYYQLLQCAL